VPDPVGGTFDPTQPSDANPIDNIFQNIEDEIKKIEQQVKKDTKKTKNDLKSILEGFFGKKN